MKINCDMGESFGHWTIGHDDQVMPFIDMANIACGMHASDPTVMLETVRLAKNMASPLVLIRVMPICKGSAAVRCLFATLNSKHFLSIKLVR